MPTYLKIPMYTAVFALLVITVVPRKEIRRLAVYGIIFGAIMDVIVLSGGQLLGTFEYINFSPLGFWFIPFFAPISWALFFILYFYFFPKNKLIMYVYVASGIGYSIFFAQLLFNTGIMAIYPPNFIPYNYFRIIAPVSVFLIWFPVSTWSFLKLSGYFESKPEKQKSFRYNLSARPARKIETEAKKIKLRKPVKLR
ncbi:MAG: hypothetical protein ACYC2T_07525 [Bacillota bacterium]